MTPTLLGKTSKNRGSRGIKLAALVLALTWGAPSVAAPGDGFHFGSRIAVRPALEVDFGYDSNVNRSNISRIPSGALTIRPKFDSKYAHEELGVRFSYEHFIQQYFASEASSYSYYGDYAGRLEADIFPRHPLGLKVIDVLSSRSYGYRSVYDNFFYGLIERSYNDLSVVGRYSPGPALDLNFGVRWLFNLENLASDLAKTAVPQSQGETVARARKNETGVVASGTWRFFPKTQLLAELNYAYASWKNTPECSKLTLSAEACAADEDARLLYKSPVVQTWSFLTGVPGQVTNALQAKVFLGYGGLYNTDDPDDFAENIGGLAGVLLQLGATYSPLDTQHFTAEFVRKYADSSIHDYYVVNGVSLIYTGMYLSRLEFTTRFSVDFRNINSTEVASSREYATHKDRVVYGTLSAKYKITRWLSAVTSFEPTITTAKPSNESALESPDPALSYADWVEQSFGYQKFLWIVGVRGTY